MNQDQIYGKVIKNLPIGFTRVDTDGNIVDFNQSAEKITGYKKSEVIGRSHLEMLHGTNEIDACPLFKHTLKRRNKSIASETTLKRKDYTYRTISVTSFPLYDNSGSFIGGVEFFHDITESKKRQRERKNFLSMFVHDMKNPVITSKGFVSRLLEGKRGPLSEKQRKYLEIIIDGLNKLEKLVMDFLEFSKYENKKYKPALKPFRIDDVLYKNIEISRLECEKKNIDITFEASENLPPIYADDVMINRVISNLLSNAIKHTNAGERILVRCLDNGASIFTQVINTGASIPEGQLPYIFNAYHQARKDKKGVGLGLAISRHIIELHKGKIWAEVTPENQTIFNFTLPKG